MTDELPRRARELLEEERHVAAPQDPALFERVWARLERTVAAPVEVASGASAGWASAAKLSTVFVTGVLTGAVGLRVIEYTSPAQSPATTLTGVTAPAVPASTTPRSLTAHASSDALATTVDSGPARPTPIAPSPPIRKTAPPVVEDDLRAEQSLLEMARSGLLSRRAETTLEAVAAHRARFPKGQLVEERDAIEIQALFLDGNADLARSRLVEFERRHPSSVMIEALRSLDGRQ